MAEGSGSAMSQTQQKYFCYKCARELSHVLDDFTCPLCKGGFIEEVAEAPASGGASQSASSVGGVRGFDFLNLLREITEPGGTGGGSANIRFQSGPPAFQRTRSEGQSPAPQPQNFSFVFDTSRQGGRGGGAGGQQAADGNQENNPMEHMLFTFLNDLIHGLGGGAAVGGAPILANYGDYAWGRDGLDTIVTQLMNQMEGTGPPPLDHEKIDTLPDVKIDQEQIDRKLQCSVCWEDFKLHECVKQLECEHIYHPDCIIPWLKLHGTCPICRKDLTGQVQEDTNQTPSARFEPIEVDVDDFDSVPIVPRNTFTPASSTRNPPAPAVLPLLNMLEPFIGSINATTRPRPPPNTTSTSTNSQPNSGRPPNNSDQSRDQDSNRQFDNMDFEFD